jgi:hypothetical protein
VASPRTITCAPSSASRRMMSSGRSAIEIAGLAASAVAAVRMMIDANSSLRQNTGDLSARWPGSARKS